MKNIALIMYMGLTGLGVMRSLGKTGVTIYGLDWNPEAVGFHSVFCQKKVLVPNPMDHPEAVIDRLLDLGRRHTSPIVLMPAADYYVTLISKNATRLSPYFRFNIPKPEILEAIVDKGSQHALAQKHQIPVPNTYSPATRDELIAIKNRICFPVLVKGLVGYRWQAAFNQKAFVAGDFNELTACFDLAEKHHLRVVIQEIIQGPNRNHYFVSAYYSEKKELLGIFSTQRTRQYPTDFGIATYTTSEYDRHLVHLGRRFFEGIGYTGMGSIEFKRDARDGVFKLIELNPRFWQQSYHATVAGVNFARINYQDCLDIHSAPCLTFKEKVRWLDFWLDMRSFKQHRRHGRITLAAWFKSVLHADAFAYFVFYDLKPFFNQLLKMVRYYFTKHINKNPGHA